MLASTDEVKFDPIDVAYKEKVPKGLCPPKLMDKRTNSFDVQFSS